MKSTASTTKRKVAIPPLARKRPITKIKEVKNKEFSS